MTELKNYLENYLNGKISEEELETWLVSNLQDILDSSNIDLILIVNEIDADLICLGEGVISKEDFRGSMQGYFTEVSNRGL